jgi:hypothetical protein
MAALKAVGEAVGARVGERDGDVVGRWEGALLWWELVLFRQALNAPEVQSGRTRQ